MHLKDHIHFHLRRTRSMTESMLASLQTDNEWFFQPHSQANHAVWIVGHLGLADNRFAARFRPDTSRIPDGWMDIFWFGSEVRGDRDIYPPRQELLEYLHDRRENLLRVIDELTDDELAAPAPALGEPSPVAGAPCIGDLLLFAASHELLHAGQLSVARRGLGYKPVRQPPK